MVFAKDYPSILSDPQCNKGMTTYCLDDLQMSDITKKQNSPCVKDGTANDKLVLEDERPYQAPWHRLVDFCQRQLL